MKIITDIPAHLIRVIQDLVKGKKYNNISEFVRISVENQISLEHPSSEEGSVDTSDLLINKNQGSALEKFKLDTERSIIAEIDAPSPKDILLPDATKEEDLWLWGQVNKIFPIKLAARYLFNVLKEGRESIELEEFYKEIATSARSVGTFLLQDDEKNNRRRDDRFSTALPIGSEKSKSFSRFCSQFVGYKRSDGILTGALFLLKFANFSNTNKEPRIGITSHGLRFAKIINPILDEKVMSKTLSVEEVEFYLSHIANDVPGEFKAFHIILSIIDKGVNSRGLINSEIKKITPQKWSDDVINTQRTGAMSRMYELGLIEKLKHGVFVEYGITEKGKQFIGIAKKKRML